MADNSSNSSGIITRSYKSGSIIYFENDKSEYIYVLKSGRVVLTSIKLDTGEEVKEEVRVGEFFGVKSALGKYPREETAQTIGETMVLVFPLVEFERLILRNANVVRKMLRVFSNQLRRIGKMVRSVMGEDENISPDEELFKIGEYYYKNGVKQHALYVFKRYMEYYPDAENASLAMKRIKAIDSGNMGYVDDFDMGSASSSSATGSDSESYGFESSSDEEPMFSFDEAPSGMDSIGGEMDNFLADEDNDDFGELDIDSNEILGMETIGSIDSARKAFSNGDYEKSIELCSDILGNESLEAEHEEAMLCRANSFAKKGNSREALQSYSAFIKSYPKSEMLSEAVYNIGSLFESSGQMDKAIAYYKKAQQVGRGDNFSQRAEQKIAQFQA